ncbi:hypothetical protein K474DRAFT_1709623 [Panus rudis PR-1116 ss-1]|nr:hypothetical protein K474DRAFT_1709623 [Panus rudis PR-1116 ss-1]
MSQAAPAQSGGTDIHPNTLSNTQDSLPDPPPQVQVNGEPANIPSSSPNGASPISYPNANPAAGEDGWGSHFWSGVSFYACPATGEVSWDPPVGHFLLPPSPDGEWWEMIDDQTGLPYYYHTKSGETVWERPQAFVIPLGILQNTALGRRLSLTNRKSQHEAGQESPSNTKTLPNNKQQSPGYRRSRSYTNTRDSFGSPSANGTPSKTPQNRRRSQSSTRNANSPGGEYLSTPNRSVSSPVGANTSASPAGSFRKHSPQQQHQQQHHGLRKSTSHEKYGTSNSAHSSHGPLSYERGHPLFPIPGSPYATDNGSPPGTPSKKNKEKEGRANERGAYEESSLDGHGRQTREGEKSPSPLKSHTSPPTPIATTSPSSPMAADLQRSRSTRSVQSKASSTSTNRYVNIKGAQPQSLVAALEMIALSSSSAGSEEEREKARERERERKERKGGSESGHAHGGSSHGHGHGHTGIGLGFVNNHNQNQHPPTTASSTSTSSSSSDKTGRRLRISTDPFSSRRSKEKERERERERGSPPATPTALKAKAFLKGKTSNVSGGVNGTGVNGVGVNGNANGTRSVSEKQGTGVSLKGKEISSPVLNAEATANLSPIKHRNAGQPILVSSPPPPPSAHYVPSELFKNAPPKRVSLNTGVHPVLPDDLASDILQFSESNFARQYFSTHRTGFIFKRRVPVSQMMTWQKAPLSSPLLQMNKSLHKEAVKTFRAIQRIMGDRDPPTTSSRTPQNASTTSLIGNSGVGLGSSGTSQSILEEERWLLSQGIAHGELRDEIYCQVMKQLNGNPSAESVFKGWQLLCVLLVTFPPSKNFETSLRSYLQQSTSQHEGRIDVMAKYCLRRLANISRKGPRGKPPTLPEIETASDAAFHPSIFGETLDVIFRLQERTYPHLKVPIILPFLADGILALGGTKSEGIFRVPGDADAVSDLKLRIDKGYYTLDGFDDPTVLASLLKLWLRELCDPLVPEELYNDCITNSHDPDACVQIVSRLPTINRRVVLFVISFLQLFLDERIQAATKMTSANLALVMAPNLLRCNSDLMSVVFTNAQYEQTFVHNLLLHLKCDKVDPDYVPSHGHGAIPPSSTQLRKSRSRRRTNNN